MEPVFVLKGPYFVAGTEVWHLTNVGCFFEQKFDTREEAIEHLNFLAQPF